MECRGRLLMSLTFIMNWWKKRIYVEYFITKLNELFLLTRGFAPGPHWGQSPQTLIGARNGPPFQTPRSASLYTHIYWRNSGALLSAPVWYSCMPFLCISRTILIKIKLSDIIRSSVPLWKFMVSLWDPYFLPNYLFSLHCLGPEVLYIITLNWTAKSCYVKEKAEYIGARDAAETARVLTEP